MSDYGSLVFFCRFLFSNHASRCIVNLTPNIAIHNLAADHLSSTSTWLHTSLSNLYNRTSGQASVHHARMHMGLSALNAHRHKYNFVNDNTCPLCNMRAESAHHYFLISLALATPRTTLLSRVFQILRNLRNQYVLFSTRQSWIASIITKWLKPPTTRCKFAVVWCSGTNIVNSQWLDIHDSDRQWSTCM